MIRFLFASCLLIATLYAQNLKKVSLQLQWHDQFQFAGYYMAKEKGFYQNAGLDVKLKKYRPNLNTIDEVMTQRADFGVGRSTLIIDKAQGKDVVLLSAIFQSSPLVLLALERDDIKRVEDFKNRKIMIDKNQNVTVAINAMIKSNNLNFEDMQLFDRTYNVNDLITKKVDLMPAYLSDKGYVLEQKGIKYRVFDPKDYGFDFYEDILFTSQNYLENNPKIVKDFQKATLQGWRYAFENIDETINVILNNYNTQRKTKAAYEYEAKTLKKLAFFNGAKFGEIDSNKVAKIYTSYNVLGFIKKNHLDFKSMIYNPSTYKYVLSKDEKAYLKQKGEVKVCIDPNWYPFEKISNEGKHIGISSEYFKLFEAHMKIPFKLIKTTSWTQTLEFAKSRKCDVLALGNATPTREEYLKFTQAYLQIPFVLSTKNEVNYVDKVEFLKDKTVGVVKNSSLNSLLKQHYPNLIIKEVKNNQDGLEKVQENEIYAYVGNMLSVTHIMQKEFMKDLKVMTKLGEHQSNLAIGVRNDDLKLHAIFDKLVKAIPEEVDQEILNKYMAVTYEQSVNYKYLKEIIVFVSLIIIFGVFVQYKLKQINEKLEKKVLDKTQELQELNETLEKKVIEEVNKNHEKDKILAQQSKMVALGEMLGNVAHQWRQPLNAISTAASGMQIYYDSKTLKKENMDEFCNMIINQSQYLSKTIDTFKSFITDEKNHHEVIIQDEIRQAIEIVKTSLNKGHIQIENDAENKEPVTMTLRKGELSQVIINLLNNSRDALIEHNIEAPKIRVELQKDDEYIVVKISDNAGGISDDIVANIFEPYFTTKHQSQGTGLGLFMSYKLVTEGLHGELLVHNEIQGAAFEIKIPL